jgi:WD40 repeat protein
MSRLDDRLTTELERTARPADPSGVFERIDQRRAQRASHRRMRMGALAIIVVLGSVGGFLALNRAFRTGDRLGGGTAEPSIVFSTYPAQALTGQPTEAIFSLYAVTPDGADLRRLTADGASASAPAWSPDGSTIAFVPLTSTPDDPALGIWVMDADGSNVRQLVQTTGPVDAVDWSADGSQLWFTMENRISSGRVLASLMTVGADGQDMRSVIDDRDITGLSASSDGHSLALSIQGDGIGGGLFVWDEAHGLQRVLPDTTFANNPAWSPDGSTIAFLGNDADHVEHIQQPQQLFLVRPDGSELRQITEGEAQLSGPSWAPSGDRLVFGSNVSHYDQFGLLTAPAICRLESIDANGTDRRTIFDGSDQDVCVASTAWQPSALGTTTGPSPTPTGSTQAGPGLGFPVCNVSSVTGTFGSPGAQGTAYVATKLGDGTDCPPVDGGFNVIAIDLDGDGVADTDYGPIECELECRVFSAPDLNGDGISELLVVQRGGTELAMGLYMMEANFGPNGVGPVPAEIAPPGDPDHGFRPGRPALLFTGGDAGNAERLYCEGSGGHTLLWQFLGSMVPFDSPDAVWKVHEIAFTLESDGMLHVFNTKNYEAPPGASPFDEPTPTDVPPGFPCVGA